MVKKLTLSILAFITKGELIGESRINTFIDHILFDSRRLNGVKGTCFFAFQSASDNGMRYLSDLYRKGVRMFVVNKTPSIIYPDASYLVVEDTLRTLQLLASSYRRLFNLPVCGITGSNGKTIVKDWIVRLIENDKQICSTIKSYNSQIGVPLCVYELKNDDDLAIFEAGISKPDEMDTLRSVIQPNIGIFTNIGDAHQVNFSSREEKINEKLKLFTGVKTLIFHDSDALLTSLIESFATSHQIRLIAFGNRDNGEYINQGYYYNTDFLLSFLTIPFSDSASIENALLAYLFCRLVGIDKKRLQSRIRNLEQLESRFEIKSGINNSLIVNDSYSCDLKSLEIALDFLSFQPKTNKIIILSDIQQVSSNKKELYSQVNNLLINKRVTSLIAIGPDFCQNQSEITVSDTSFFLTVRDFLLNLKRKDFANKAVLIKGSAKMDFDLISESLCEKKHRSVLEINLTALTDNVRYFRQKLSPSTLLMAMVKADSYGTGAYQVAYTLQSQHLADCLAVAFVDEGVELRQKGITLPVLVMTPEGDKDLFKEYDLEPVIHNFTVWDKFKQSSLSVHIALDTGMHRLGFEPKDMNALAKELKTYSQIKVKSVFSHLYGADDPSLDAYTYSQIQSFEKMSSFICSLLPYKVLRHLCNSAAIVRFPQIHYDMVRLGIGMYGIGCNSLLQSHLRKTHRLRSVITQIREIEKGEDVSYSRKFVSDKKMRIGVVPIGYADGFLRKGGNGNFKVWINGSLCSIIGNVCMDMCMVDLTSTDAKVGDTVVFFGNENPVEHISQSLQTIPYEIFTSVSARIKRVYYQE